MIIKNLKKYFTFEVMVSLFCIVWSLTWSERFWMTRMSEDGSGLQTINRQHGSSHLSVQCLCVLMTAGTRFSSTFPVGGFRKLIRIAVKILTPFSKTSPVEHTAQTTLRRCEFKFMRIAVFDVSTSQIDFTQRMNCRPNSNYTCPCKTSKNKIPTLWTPIRLCE